MWRLIGPIFKNVLVSCHVGLRPVKDFGASPHPTENENKLIVHPSGRISHFFVPQTCAASTAGGAALI